MPGAKKATAVIRLYPETKKRYRALKVIEHETDDDIARRLLDEYERRDGSGQERRKAS